MSIHLLGRLGAVLCLATLMTGCMSSRTTSRLFNECTWDRDSCMYEGPYDSDEAEYAEEEARRRNNAQIR